MLIVTVLGGRSVRLPSEPGDQTVQKIPILAAVQQMHGRFSASGGAGFVLRTLAPAAASICCMLMPEPALPWRGWGAAGTPGACPMPPPWRCMSHLQRCSGWLWGCHCGWQQWRGGTEGPHPPSRPRAGFTPAGRSGSLPANGILLSGANPALPAAPGAWCDLWPDGVAGQASSGLPPPLLSLQVEDGPCDGGCRPLAPARALPAPHRRPG